MLQIRFAFFSLLIAMSLALFGSSCMTTKTNVGDFVETKGRTYLYGQGKQLWLFWGIIPLSRTSVNTPADGNCQVITRRRLGDMLITFLTLGIVSSYSIRVKVRREGRDGEIKRK